MSVGSPTSAQHTSYGRYAQPPSQRDLEDEFFRGAGLALKYLADLAKDMGDTGGARDGYARALEMLRAAGDEPAAAKTEKALADLNR